MVVDGASGAEETPGAPELFEQRADETMGPLLANLPHLVAYLLARLDVGSARVEPATQEALRGGR